MPDSAYSGIIDSSGTLTIRVQSRPRSWSVSQISVKADSAPAGYSCTVHKNGTFVTPITLYTNGGGLAAGPPNVELGPSDVITIDFLNMTAGDNVEVSIMYEVV
jgi:hypothetical protein